MTMPLRTILIAAFVSSIFASCGGAEGTAIEATGEKVSDASGEKTTAHKDLLFKMNDVIKLGDYVITVTKVADNAPAPDEYSLPEKGKKFVAVEVIYENRTTDKQLDYNPFDWKLIDGDGYTYEMDINSPKEPTLQSGTINPGQKTRGWINFQASKDADNFKLQFQPNWISNENVEVKL